MWIELEMFIIIEVIKIYFFSIILYIKRVLYKINNFLKIKVGRF